MWFCSIKKSCKSVKYGFAVPKFHAKVEIIALQYQNHVQNNQNVVMLYKKIVQKCKSCGFAMLKIYRILYKTKNTTHNQKTRWINGLHHLHKKLYKECSYKKPQNVDVTAFVAFKFVSKLSFGNVFWVYFVYAINPCCTKAPV